MVGVLNQEADLSPKKRMSQRTKILIGCGAGVLVALCACMIASVLYFQDQWKDPEHLVVSTDYPWTVQNGQGFDLTLYLYNSRTEPFTVGDIDLDILFFGSILDGAVVESTDPHMTRDYSIPGLKTFHFDRSIQPGETEKATFHLRAIQSGDFGGTIAVYVGDHSRLIDVSISISP